MNVVEPYTYPPRGTPVQLADVPTMMAHGEWAEGVTAHIGDNIEAARQVALETADPITWPCHVLGFLNEDHTLALTIVLHLDDDGRVQVSAADRGLPWSRKILAWVACHAFMCAGADEIVVRLRPEDGRARRFVQRLGFKRIGAEAREGDIFRIRHVFTLPASAAEQLLRRYRAKN